MQPHGLVVLLSLHFPGQDAISLVRDSDPCRCCYRAELAAKRARPGVRLRPSAWRAFYTTALLSILLVIYWAASIHTKLDIGHRNILPTYPAMFILAGAASYWFRPYGRRQGVMSAAVWLCILALAGECFAMYPHYLAYFNQLAGGPSNGYKHLVIAHSIGARICPV